MFWIFSQFRETVCPRCTIEHNALESKLSTVAKYSSWKDNVRGFHYMLNGSELNPRGFSLQIFLEWNPRENHFLDWKTWCNMKFFPHKNIGAIWNSFLTKIIPYVTMRLSPDLIHYLKKGVPVVLQGWNENNQCCLGSACIIYGKHEVLIMVD